LPDVHTPPRVVGEIEYHSWLLPLNSGFESRAAHRPQAPLAEWGQHRALNPGTGVRNPHGAPIFSPQASSGLTGSVFQTEGSEFEARHRFDTDVARLVEQRSPKPRFWGFESLHPWQAGCGATWKRTWFGSRRLHVRIVSSRRVGPCSSMEELLPYKQVVGSSILCG